MADKFVVHRNEPGEVSPAAGLFKTMRRVRARISPTPSDRFEIHTRGTKDRATRYDYNAALKLLRKRLDASEVGTVTVLNAGHARVEVRRVAEPVPLPEQSAHWPNDQRQLYSFVFGGRFPGVRWGGTCNCRETRQGGSLSDHACCRALDVFPSSKRQGDEIYLTIMRNREKFNVRYISWQVALHYDHLHIATGEPCGGCY